MNTDTHTQDRRQQGTASPWKGNQSAISLNELYNRAVTDVTGIEDAESSRNKLRRRLGGRTFLKGLPSMVLLGAGIGAVGTGILMESPVATTAGAGSILGSILWQYRNRKNSTRDYNKGPEIANKMTTEEHKSFLIDLYSGKLAATPGNIGIADAILAERLQALEQDQQHPVENAANTPEMAM